MKAVFSAAAFAAAASAAVLRRDQCCFQITASGSGLGGQLGQLSDGQNRINGSYAPETYCYSNGGIIDAHGRGCIVTIGNDATHQFQCDEGKPPTLGFSIANNGSILYQGSDQFYACPYEYEYNVYTQWLKDQKKCRPVKLSMEGGCAGTTGGFAAPSGSAPGYSIPAYGGPSAGGSVPGNGQQTPPVGYSSYGTAPVPTGYGSQSVPSYGPSSQPVVPGFGGSSEITSAVTMPSTAPGYEGSSASSVESSPVESTPAVPGYGSGSSAMTSQATVPGYGSGSASAPVPSASSQQISVPGYGGSASVPGIASSVETSPVESTVSQPSVPGYGGSSSAPAPSSPNTETVQTTQIYSVPCSSCEGQTSDVTQTSPAPSTPVETSPAESTPGVPGYGDSSSAPAPTSEAPSVPGYGGSSAPGPSTTPQESSPVESTPGVPGYGGSSAPALSSAPAPSSEVPSVPGYGESSAPAPSTTPQESSPVESTPGVSSYPAGSSSAPTAPAETPGTETVQTTQVYTVPCSSCEGQTSVVTQTPPAQTTPVQSTTPQESSPMEWTPGVPGYGGSSPIVTEQTTPAPTASVPEETTITMLTTVYTSDCETTETQVSSGTTFSSVYTTQSTFTVSTGVPSSPASAPSQGVPSYGTGVPSSPAPAPSTGAVNSTTAPIGTGSVPGYGAPSSSMPVASSPATSVETAATTPAQSIPGYGGSSQATESTAVPTTPASSVETAATTPAQSIPGYGGSSSQNTETGAPTPSESQATSVPGYGASTTEVVSTTSAVSPPQSSVPATSASGSACQTSLTGSYQTPHLIVPIASSYPDTPQGNSQNASVNSDCSTIFNFDIPQDYEGKQCSVVFLFPEEKDLETSAYSFSGSGDLVFSQCSGNANEQTTYNNAPAKNGTLDSVCIEPGNSYVVQTAPCAAGTTQSYELSSANGLTLEFFEDWNPSSLGLYITAC